MSIEGITNYEHARYEYERPAWERLERIDYCDQEIPEGFSDWFGKVKAFFKRMI